MVEGVLERLGSDSHQASALASDAARLRRVGILGTGLIGGSTGQALRAAGFEVVGVDRDAHNLALALDLGAIDFSGGIEDLAECDVVVVAVSTASVIRTVELVLDTVTSDVTVIDVASVKSALSNAISEPNFCGTHPMRGGHTSGPGAAKANLFLGATWAICPTNHTSDDAIADTTALIRNAGAEPVRIDPVDHDHMVARTSHLPHVVASALVLAVADADPEATFAFTGGGFRDTSRIARSEMGWAEICLTNREAVIPAIETIERGLAAVRRALVASDAGSVEDFFAKAADLLRTHLPEYQEHA